MSAKHSERLHLDLQQADLSQLESALGPTLSDDSLLSRLPFTRRRIPAWLANRSMEGDVAISRFSVRQSPLGPLSTHFVWQGTAVQLISLHVALPTGMMEGSGTLCAVGAAAPLSLRHESERISMGRRPAGR